jgi:hypothetical protein
MYFFMYSDYPGIGGRWSTLNRMVRVVRFQKQDVITMQMAEYIQGVFRLGQEQGINADRCFHPQGKRYGVAGAHLHTEVPKTPAVMDKGGIDVVYPVSNFTMQQNHAVTLEKFRYQVMGQWPRRVDPFDLYDYRTGFGGADGNGDDSPGMAGLKQNNR